MIKIDYSTEPDLLSSDTVINALGRIRDRVNADQSPAIEKNDELWRDASVTDKLHDSHHGKCCYCERIRDRKREMDVEHYRPKGKVKDVDGHKGYWWLVFKWDNLLWSCKTCNQKYKDIIFTLLPNTTRAHDETSDLNLERPCLINPKIEDPSQFLSFHIDRSGGRCFVTVVPRAGIENAKETRATETIIIVGLNRKEHGYDLVQERGNEFSRTDFEMIVFGILRADDAKDKVPENRQIYIDTINSLREKLKNFIQSDRVFSGVYRDYLRRHNIEYESLL
jgi:uncharacterized protein (TIGR02646 family)